jgi:hypothetical protein
MKKPWSEPVLIELVRAGVEESVLEACRTGAGATSPESFGVPTCVCVDGELNRCTTCYTLTHS